MPPARTFASAATLAVLLALLLAVTGCGADSAEPSSTDTPSQGADPSPPAGGGLDQGQLDEIRECLDAAGLEDAFPTDLPSGAPTDMPTDLPSDLPSDIDPDNLPEGLPSDGPGGGFSALQDPEVQDALDACGIELPQRPTPSEG